jgi:uncharacterized membrane protein YgcG
MFTRVAVALLATLSALSTIFASAAAADDDFGSHSPGQHVYDRANVLRSDQVQTLEQRAATLDALGAPTIVYVRVQAATQSEVQQEARELMDAWDVESARGAHDGFVVVVDLTPGNTQHGQLGMFAGAEHAGAELDTDELNRIASDVMRPSMASGDLVGGLSAGLDAAAEDLGGPASADGAAYSSDPTNPSNLPKAALIALVLLPFILPLVVTAMVLIFVANIVRRTGSARGWSSSSGYSSYSGWTDSGSSSWSSSDSGSGGGGDSGSASSGGDSGGASF